MVLMIINNGADDNRIVVLMIINNGADGNK